MSSPYDPNYHAQPKHAPEPWHCDKCGGVIQGYVGLEGEWPCMCQYPDGEDLLYPADKRRKK